MKNHAFKQDLYENPCKTMKIHEIRSPGLPQAYISAARAPYAGFRVYILYMQISQEHRWDAAPMYGKPDGYNIELCDWLDLLVIGL